MDKQITVKVQAVEPKPQLPQVVTVEVKETKQEEKTVIVQVMRA